MTEESVLYSSGLEAQSERSGAKRIQQAQSSSVLTTLYSITACVAPCLFTSQSRGKHLAPQLLNAQFLYCTFASAFVNCRSFASWISAVSAWGYAGSCFTERQLI